MPQHRLVKVIVQPVLVLDDGAALTEVPVQPMAIPAADWPAFAADGIDQILGELNTRHVTAASEEEG